MVKPPASHPSTAQQSVLIVDDDRVVRLTLAQALRKSGYAVLEAADGPAGIEIVREQKPDVVLLDAIMPGLDGFETCREVRKLAKYDQLPVFMLTSIDQVDKIDRAFDLGVTDFLVKPIRFSLLLPRIRFALRARDMGVALRRHEERLAQAQRVARFGYWEVFATGDAECSDGTLNLLGLTGSRFRARDDLLDLVPQGERQQIRAAIEAALRTGASYELEHRMLRADGQLRVLHHQGEPHRDGDGQIVGLLGTLQDVTERRRAEAMIDYQTYYDAVTGLPNRRLFSDRMSHAIASALQSEQIFVIGFVGLEGFRRFNESMGHDAGDKLLRNVAQRLEQSLKSKATIARMYNDVFAILTEPIPNPLAIESMATDLQHMFEKPFLVEQRELFVKGHVGLAIFPEDGDSVHAMLRSAEAAMARAREHQGSAPQRYVQGMSKNAEERLTLESDLRKAIQRDELVLYYQPQIDARTGSVVAAEALLRWQRHKTGLVSPAEFIPIAESTGLIVPIGEWVLRTACAQAAAWEAAGYPIRVGVNLSARQFAEADLVGVVKSALKESKLDPDWLELEITESVAMVDLDATIAVLGKLQECGVEAALDDFGTGYASLSYLQKLPVSTLKIDRSFVMEIGEDDIGQSGAIARAIVALAKSMGKEIIAEGVETPFQAMALKAMGCGLLQGYLYGKPVPVAEFDMSRRFGD